MFKRKGLLSVLALVIFFVILLGVIPESKFPGQLVNSSFSWANQYTVKPGDTLFKVAMQNVTTAEAIKEANNLKTDLIKPGQVLTVPQKTTGAQQTTLPLKDIPNAGGIGPGALEDLIITIDKSDKTLSLYQENNLLKSYPVEFGEGGLGDKRVAGDRKTPEGRFYVSEKSVLSPIDQYLGSRWMRLSYPNIEDADRGVTSGLINRQVYDEIVSAISNGKIPPQRTALGGGIGIHGGTVPEFGENWTWGCIGLTNRDVEEFFDYIPVGTPVIIQK